MKELKSIAKKVINSLVDAPQPDSFGWPPVCGFILYQPERPVAEASTSSDSENKE